MLYQYIVKVLMGNSDTVFSALVMGVFGYVCWLLWNINERSRSFINDWNKHEGKLDLLKDKMDKIDEGVYRELLTKLEKNLEEMDKLLLVVNDNNRELERMRSEILSEIKDSADELKDIIILVVNNKSRSVNHSKKGDEKNKNKSGNQRKINE
ncbi:MAG: hypothetical protein ACOCQW_02315 [Halanaerobiaceae bacterium]